MATHQIAHAADHRATALTPRGAAVLAILRVRDQLPELDVADREHVAPLLAELLADACRDVPQRR